MNGVDSGNGDDNEEPKANHFAKKNRKKRETERERDRHAHAHRLMDRVHLRGSNTVQVFQLIFNLI